MSRRYVQQLAEGEPIDDVFLVSDKNLRANRNGNRYIQVELRDRTGSIDGLLFNATDAQVRAFEAGDFALVKGKVQRHQGGLQVLVNNIERLPPERADIMDFLPRTEQDVGKLTERLRALLRKIGNPHLQALSQCFLMDAELMNAFQKCPAGVRQHHAYVGGLLEHVVTMLDFADRIAPLYPKLDRDLLMMGVFLHDLGKVRELTFERTFGYSDEGQLVGHLVIGCEILGEKARQAPDLTGEPFPHELLLRLKHMIVSHHGTYDFGSPKLPMTPEAIALHHIDNFDAKVHTFTRDIAEDTNSTSAWTPYDSSLQRRLFKGRPEKPTEGE